MKPRWWRRREIVAGTLGLLLVGVLVSWVVSLGTPHGTYVTATRRYGLWCDSGSVQFRYGVITELNFDEPGRWTVREVSYRERSSPHWGRNSIRVILAKWPPWQQAEFASGGEAPTINGTSEFFGERVRIWGVPHWFVAALFMLPLIWMAYGWWRTRAERRVARGLCGNCGYDMRASPERCPECGATRSAPLAGT